jgi:predicted RNase H-like HicB family nuclease
LGVTPQRRRTIDVSTGDCIVKLDIESEIEEDGRWLAEVPQLPGVLAYGSTRDEAMARAQVLALRVLAERLEHGESGPESISISVAAA